MVDNLGDIPSVSVITCFFNEKQFLQESVESVLRQESVKWELLLIDDGSNDGSTELAKKYAEKYPGKILYFEHENHQNKGLSASRNLGILHASGEFISFLDGDDVWCPGFLQQLLEIIKKEPVSMVCEATEYWYQWKENTKKDVIIPVGTKGDQLYPPPQLMMNLYPLGKGAAPCLCGLLVKKNILVKHGGFNEEFKGMYEDQVFLSKFYLHEKIYISSQCKNRYRQREGSLVYVSHAKGTYEKERRKFLDWLEKYFQQEGINDKPLDKLLKKALFPYRYPLLTKFRHLIPKAIKKWGKRIFSAFRPLR